MSFGIREGKYPLPTYIAKLFYLGASYHGSQWQPNVRTIQGELVEALSSWSHEEHTHDSVILSGRTDSGVSSLGQIVRFTTEKKPNLEKINSYLPDDISLWGISQVSHDYNPRFKVLFRHYRYYLETKGLVLDFEKIRIAQEFLIGLNNYALISKPDADRNTLTTILNISSKDFGNHIVFDFYGVSFLWKLVRKSVTLLKWIGLGLYPPEIIRELLNGKKMIPGGIEPSPPEGLILIESAIPMKIKTDLKALKRMKKVVTSRAGFHRRTVSMLNKFTLDFLSGQMLSY